MSLFKSAEERRIERDIKIRQGIRRIEKSIAEQNKFTDEFIRNARRAKEIGDESQYQFIRNSLKKTATVKKDARATTARGEECADHQAAGRGVH